MWAMIKSMSQELEHSQSRQVITQGLEDELFQLFVRGEAGSWYEQGYRQVIGDYFSRFKSMDEEDFADDLADSGAAYVDFFKAQYGFCPEYRTRVTMRIACGLRSPNLGFHKAALSGLLAIAQRQNRRGLDPSLEGRVRDMLIPSSGQAEKIEDFLIEIEDRLRPKVYENAGIEQDISLELEKAAIRSFIFDNPYEFDPMNEFIHYVDPGRRPVQAKFVELEKVWEGIWKAQPVEITPELDYNLLFSDSQ